MRVKRPTRIKEKSPAQLYLSRNELYLNITCWIGEGKTDRKEINGYYIFFSSFEGEKIEDQRSNIKSLSSPASEWGARLGTWIWLALKQFLRETPTDVHVLLN